MRGIAGLFMKDPKREPQLGIKVWEPEPEMVYFWERH